MESFGGQRKCTTMWSGIYVRVSVILLFLCNFVWKEGGTYRM